MSDAADSSSTAARRDGRVERLGDPALQRRDEQVRGVQALLGGVVQLPRDPLALGLDRQPLTGGALERQPPQRLRRIGQGDDEHERQRDVDGQRLGGHELQPAGDRAADHATSRYTTAAPAPSHDGAPSGAPLRAARGWRATAGRTGCASRPDAARTRASRRVDDPRAGAGARRQRDEDRRAQRAVEQQEGVEVRETRPRRRARLRSRSPPAGRREQQQPGAVVVGGRRARDPRGQQPARPSGLQRAPMLRVCRGPSARGRRPVSAANSAVTWSAKPYGAAGSRPAR